MAGWPAKPRIDLIVWALLPMPEYPHSSGTVRDGRAANVSGGPAESRREAWTGGKTRALELQKGAELGQQSSAPRAACLDARGGAVIAHASLWRGAAAH